MNKDKPEERVTHKHGSKSNNVIQPLNVTSGQDEVVNKLTLPQHFLTQILGYEPSINSQMFRKVHWFHLTFSKKSSPP